MSAYHRAIGAMSNQSCQALGGLGEFVALCQFKMSGYECEPAKQGEGRGDLKVFHPKTGQEFRVEVKTSRKGKDKKWRFKLFKAGHTQHYNCDFVALLAVRGSGRVVGFLIPIEELKSQKQVVISSDPDFYRGRFAKYRQHDFLRLPQWA